MEVVALCSKRGVSGINGRLLVAVLALRRLRRFARLCDVLEVADVLRGQVPPTLFYTHFRRRFCRLNFIGVVLNVRTCGVPEQTGLLDQPQPW